MKLFAYAKVNIFLKIVGIRENYHELISRFIRVKNLYDTISFEKKSTISDKFELIGDFGCPTSSNTIYKAYQLISNLPKVKKFFKEHKVIVEKNIPEFAGLGGGSSDAATFLLLCNNILNLNLSKNELNNIGKQIGADVSFFIYEFDSANVSGVGEIVEKFDEKAIEIETFTPIISCDTGLIYKKYREEFIEKMDKNLADKLSKMSSLDILQNYNALTLNDLFAPALIVEPKLKEYYKEKWFFSGSGSSYFRIKNG